MSDGVTETTIKLKKTAKTVVISCPEQLDISVVNELHGLLNEQIEQCATSKATIKLDAKQVDKADTSALQLLTALFIDAKAQKIKVKWAKPSETLMNAAKLLGLQNELGLDSAS